MLIPVKKKNSRKDIFNPFVIFKLTVNFTLECFQS